MQDSAGRQQSVPLLSICVPAYNGLPAIVDLIETLLKCSRSEFEVVVSDDGSSDETYVGVQAIADRDSRVRCTRNAVNQGMDRNFARAVELARGRYVWFCGQDDIIAAEGVEAVLAYLDKHEETDFLYMNHSKRVEGRNGERLVSGTSSDDIVCGRGLDSFLRHTGYVLPTFLPTYVLRRSLWDNVDVSRYFGTAYCQVGVFIEASRDLNWCHFAGTFVTGRLPQDGWQANPMAYTRIAFGHIAMVARASTKAPWLGHDTIAALYRRQRRRLLYSFILLRHRQLEISRDLLDEVLRAIAPHPDVARSILIVRALPRLVTSLLFHMIDLKRFVRSRCEAREYAA